MNKPVGGRSTLSSPGVLSMFRGELYFKVDRPLTSFVIHTAGRGIEEGDITEQKVSLVIIGKNSF